jgi:hypothetical protein
MALKTQNQLLKKLCCNNQGRVALAIRKPGFNQACEDFNKKIVGGSLTQQLIDAGKFENKHGAMPVDASGGHQDIAHYCRVSMNVNSADKISKVDVAEDILFALLEDGRWLSLKLNLQQDKELLLFAVGKKIDQMQSLIKKIGGVPNIEKLERYLAVFDLRNKRPPVPYDRILSELWKYYGSKKKSREKMINLCKRDFLVAFKAIYGVSYKEYRSKDINRSEAAKKSCKECPSRNKCKELCADVAFSLTEETISRKEKLLITDRQDKYDKVQFQEFIASKRSKDIGIT